MCCYSRHLYNNEISSFEKNLPSLTALYVHCHDNYCYGV